jgi:hypothetical protein
MVHNIQTDEKLYSILQNIGRGEWKEKAGILIVFEKDGMTEHIQIYPPYTIGHPIGANSSLWYWEVKWTSSINTKFSRKFFGSIADPASIPNSIHNSRLQLDGLWPWHVVVKSTTPVVVEEKTTFLEEAIGVVREWIGDTLRIEWRPSKWVIVGGFVLLWIWLLSGMLLN